MSANIESVENKLVEDNTKKIIEKYGYDIPFPFEFISTRHAEGYTNEQLLMRIRGLNLIGVKGWGLLAELCKRFENLVVNQDGEQ